MKLVERWWAEMWKLWSIHLGMIASLAIGYFSAQPEEWTAIVSMLPEEFRPFVGVIAFVTLTYARMSVQKGGASQKVDP